MVKQGNRRITLLIVELIQEEDIPIKGNSIYQLNFLTVVDSEGRGKRIKKVYL